MLVRICLILAILTGAGVIVVSQFKVKPHIQSIIDDRDTNARQREEQRNRANKAEKDLKDTQGRLAKTESELSDTRGLLTQSRAEAESFKNQASVLQTNLDERSRQLEVTQQDLAAWKALGIPVEQVQATIDSEKKLRDANAVLEEEKKVLQKVATDLKRRVDVLLGERVEDPVLPAGLKGTVLIVDPKWEFVVLDIGEKDGLVQNGVLMVSRNNKLVAKVRVVTVQPNRSIANLMPNWKLDDVQEGDQVLY
jgi:hypothetical protein